MNIRDLIDSLEALAEEHGDETDVRLAHQPSWPFEHAIGQIVAVGLDDEAEEDQPAVVYIGESSQIGYLPGVAASALGWK